MLAYSFGLRHAFDADHIATIDNVTRKLMQEGKRPVVVGLFFSLGHSTIVVGLSVAIAITATALQSQFDTFKTVPGVVGTLVSALFLFAIAFANILVLISVYRTFRTVKKSGRFVEEDLDLVLANRGLLGRLFRRSFRVIERSWLEQNLDRRLPSTIVRVSDLRKFQIEFASGTRSARVSPRNRMNDKRSLIRYSVRSSESEWLACRIKTLNIRM